MLCYACSNKPRDKAPIFCEKRHILTYVKNKYLHEVCSGCDNLRKCRLICKQCDPQAMYCAKCKPADLRRSCYMGHPYKENTGSILRECFICRHYKQTIDCAECNFSVCETCRDAPVSRPQPRPKPIEIEAVRPTEVIKPTEIEPPIESAISQLGARLRSLQRLLSTPPSSPR